MKILFLSTRQSKPSFRFRVEQMLPDFRAAGHADEIAFLPESVARRLLLYRTFPSYDAIFIQKRLFSRGELFLVRRWAKRLIYDLDDAVMFDGRGRDDGRRRARFGAMMHAADLVIAGNGYLADEARHDGANVAIVPTVIDSNVFHPRQRAPRADGPITIGWTGSRSTNRYLNSVFPVLARFGKSIRVKIISDTTDGLEFDRLGDVPHEFVRWSPEIEVSEAATFDIGLMPLPDDPWTRGKCGFKALQYMGLGIPAVCSPVGVNCEILAHGKTGYLPATPDAWHTCLAELISDPDLRATIGDAGRRRLEDAYALNVQGPRLVKLIETACSPWALRAA